MLVLQILLQIGFVIILKILRMIGVVTSGTLAVGGTVDFVSSDGGSVGGVEDGIGLSSHEVLV